MPHIALLDQITIDKIAAGEVVERPSSVVKELVENAIDAGSTSITVEIEEGGIALIRVTDNGCGISRDEVESAFLRHSTSKIHCAEDLDSIASLGFRGEALSSIAAVSRVELITKVRGEVFGTRYVVEGGAGKELEDTGAPDGTMFLVRQLFYNTPARRKFLRSPMTEAAHIHEIMMRLMLSHPEVSFQFIHHKQVKLHTSGNGKLKDVIYQIYGRDIANNLLPLAFEKNGVKLEGYLGKPIISRGNRNFENYFVNGRYVKSHIISKAIEDAYHDYTMQHKYPFVAFHMTLDQQKIDVNVHPTKMELRFSSQQEVYQMVYEGVREGLTQKELIQKIELPEAKHIPDKDQASVQRQVSVQNTAPAQKQMPSKEEEKLNYFMEKMKERVHSYHDRMSQAEVTSKDGVFRPEIQVDRIKEAARYAASADRIEKTQKNSENSRVCSENNRAYSGNEEHKTECTPQITERTLENKASNVEKSDKTEYESTKIDVQNEQLSFFSEKMMKKDIRQEYTLIGQIFETYWLIEYKDSLYIIDQHAAHERVLYEHTLHNMKNRSYTSQYLSPPVIISLTMQEEVVLKEHMERFQSIGFEIEPFGGKEYAVRAVPDNLFSIAKEDLLLEMLDGLADGLPSNLASAMIDEKIASMSCKAAVKGKSRLSAAEMDALIAELLTLDNPYHCPHGRPTIISMTRRDLEKKFKRVL